MSHQAPTSVPMPTLVWVAKKPEGDRARGGVGVTAGSKVCTAQHQPSAVQTQQARCEERSLWWDSCGRDEGRRSKGMRAAPCLAARVPPCIPGVASCRGSQGAGAWLVVLNPWHSWSEAFLRARCAQAASVLLFPAPTTRVTRAARRLWGWNICVCWS